MQQVIVQYKVKADKVDENIAHVHKVYEELQQNSPDGLRYVTFRKDDGVSFVHIAVITTENGENPLHDVKAFQAFTANIADRCDEPPVVTDITEIGAYGFPEMA